MRETPPGLPRPWILTHGPERWHFGERPLVLGRLPDSDVVITDPEVSRIHAWLVPTPQGPVLVNRGQHGVQVNGEWVSTPRCLSAGDAITIGRATYCLEMGPPAESDAPRAARGFPKRLGSWVARYGPSEVLGTVTAVVVAVAMHIPSTAINAGNNRINHRPGGVTSGSCAKSGRMVTSAIRS